MCARLGVCFGAVGGRGEEAVGSVWSASGVVGAGGGVAAAEEEEELRMMPLLWNARREEVAAHSWHMARRFDIGWKVEVTKRDARRCSQ